MLPNTFENWTFKDSREAFDDAITRGWFSNEPRHGKAYAGHWMYVGTRPDGHDAYKNIDTRRYIYIPPHIKPDGPGWPS